MGCSGDGESHAQAEELDGGVPNEHSWLSSSSSFSSAANNRKLQPYGNIGRQRSHLYIFEAATGDDAASAEKTLLINQHAAPEKNNV